MKKVVSILILLITFAGAFAQQNLRGNRVSSDTTKHSTIDEIPSWPATGLKEFYHQDTLKGIDSLGVIHYLTKQDRSFRYEFTADGITSIPTSIKLNKNCKVFFNGNLIPVTQWSGIDSFTITLTFQTYTFDFLIINNGSQ